jgi:hypothetical protein
LESVYAFSNTSNAPILSEKLLENQESPVFCQKTSYKTAIGNMHRHSYSANFGRTFRSKMVEYGLKWPNFFQQQKNLPGFGEKFG